MLAQKCTLKICRIDGGSGPKLQYEIKVQFTGIAPAAQ